MVRRVIFLICGVLLWNPTLASLQTYALMGDAGYWNQNTRALRDHLMNQNIYNLVMPGDNLYELHHLSYKEAWDPWRIFNFKFDVVAIGNHNLGYQKEMDYFNLPGTYFKKQFGKTVFLVLNSDDKTNVSAQQAWIENELTQINDELVFVMFHHPPVTVSNRHKWEESKGFHLVILPTVLLYRSKIQALIVGHDHIASLHTLDDFPVIVAGATSNPIPTRPKNYVNKRGHFVQTRYLSTQGVYWVRLDINAKTRESWFNFVNITKNKVHCSALIHDQSLFLKQNCTDSLTRAVFEN